MINTVNLKELRPSLPRIVERIDKKLDRFVITKRGKPVVMMINIDDYEALIETLDILADKKALDGLRKGTEDLQHGRTVSWKEVKKSLAKI